MTNNVQKVLYVWYAAFVWLFLAWCTAPALSQDASVVTDDTISAEISTGVHHFNVSGYRGKVGEYDVLKSGADSTFSVTGNRGKNYFDMYGEFVATDDQKYSFNVDLQRIFQTELSYKKFIHYLDHDSLDNQDFVTDYNPGRDNHIRIEELKSGNTLRIPLVPFLKFKMNYRSYNKRGHRQATTVAKCSECHVSSRNKRIDSNTEDVAFSVEGTAGPATLEYTHLERSFTEGATPPVNNYGSGASFFLVNGYNPYSVTPDINNSIHEIRFRSLLPFSSSLYASYQAGEKNNRDTSNEVDYSNIAGRLSTLFFRYCAIDTFYNQYHMQNSTPDGIERDVKRGGVDLSTYLKKKINLKFSYLWENIDRDNFSVNDTKKKTYRLTANYRALRKLRFHFKYEKARVGEPFVTQDLVYPRLVQTSQPQVADEYYGSMSWNVRQNVTLNTSFRYLASKNDRYDVDEDRYEFTMSFWYVPFEQMNVNGAYTLSDNSVESPISYKRYHSTDIKSLFFYDDLPYDDESQAYFLAVNYVLHHRISLTGELTYTRSISDFDSSLNTSNLGNLSDIKIRRLDTAIGLTYLYSNRLTVSAKYMFREYNDKRDNTLDGQLNGVSMGLTWSFK
jgi:hypothetical protein